MTVICSGASTLAAHDGGREKKERKAVDLYNGYHNVFYIRQYCSWQIFSASWLSATVIIRVAQYQ